MPRVITADIIPQEHIFYPNTGSTEATILENREGLPNCILPYQVLSPVFLSGILNIVFDKSSGHPIINGDKKTYDSVHLYTDEELLSYIVDIDGFNTMPPRKRFSIDVEIGKVTKGKPAKMSLEDF